MGTSYGMLTGLEASKKGYLPAKVMLDGIEMKNVSVVNDVAGWIEVFETNDNGNIIAIDGDTRTYRLYGDVVYIPFGST